MSITLILIIITCIISLVAFSKPELMEKFIFYPPAVTDNNQWYRFFSSAFLHGDYAHLFFNMYTFYLFGNAVEEAFGQIFGSKGTFMFLLLYFTAMPVSLLPTYIKNKHNTYYQSLGASGAVSAIVFAFILLEPMVPMGLMFIPVHIPAFIFGILYLGVSAFLNKKGDSHINHSAHIFGALYGIIFLLLMGNVVFGVPVLQHFMESIRYYLGK